MDATPKPWLAQFSEDLKFGASLSLEDGRRVVVVQPGVENTGVWVTDGEMTFLLEWAGLEKATHLSNGFLRNEVLLDPEGREVTFASGKGCHVFHVLGNGHAFGFSRKGEGLGDPKAVREQLRPGEVWAGGSPQRQLLILDPTLRGGGVECFTPPFVGRFRATLEDFNGLRRVSRGYRLGQRLRYYGKDVFITGMWAEAGGQRVAVTVHVPGQGPVTVSLTEILERTGGFADKWGKAEKAAAAPEPAATTPALGVCVTVQIDPEVKVDRIREVVERSLGTRSKELKPTLEPPKEAEPPLCPNAWQNFSEDLNFGAQLVLDGRVFIVTGGVGVKGVGVVGESGERTLSFEELRRATRVSNGYRAGEMIRTSSGVVPFAKPSNSGSRYFLSSNGNPYSVWGTFKDEEFVTPPISTAERVAEYQSLLRPGAKILFPWNPAPRWVVDPAIRKGLRLLLISNGEEEEGCIPKGTRQESPGVRLGDVFNMSELAFIVVGFTRTLGHLFIRFFSPQTGLFYSNRMDQFLRSHIIPDGVTPGVEAFLYAASTRVVLNPQVEHDEVEVNLNSVKNKATPGAPSEAAPGAPTPAAAAVAEMVRGAAQIGSSAALRLGVRAGRRQFRRAAAAAAGPLLTRSSARAQAQARSQAKGSARGAELASELEEFFGSPVGDALVGAACAGLLELASAHFSSARARELARTVRGELLVQAVEAAGTLLDPLADALSEAVAGAAAGADPEPGPPRALEAPAPPPVVPNPVPTPVPVEVPRAQRPS